MKLKLDENLPESLIAALSALGHDVDNVRLEGLSGQSDPNIWRAAQAEGRFLITQDLVLSRKTSTSRTFASSNRERITV